MTLVYPQFIAECKQWENIEKLYALIAWPAFTKVIVKIIMHTFTITAFPLLISGFIRLRAVNGVQRAILCQYAVITHKNELTQWRLSEKKEFKTIHETCFNQCKCNTLETKAFDECRALPR